MIKITDVEKVTEETLERDFSEFEKSELVNLKEQNKDVCICGTCKKEIKAQGAYVWGKNIFCSFDCLRRFDAELKEPAQEETIKRIKSFLAMRKAEGKTNVSVMEIAEITKVDAELVEEIMNETEGVKEAQDEEVCKNCGQRIVHIKADTYVHMTQKESCLRPEPKEPSKDVCRNCGVEIISIEEAIKRMNEMKGVKEAQDEEKKVICDMCEAENDSDSINCKMCKRELKIGNEAHARRHEILMLISELWERYPNVTLGKLLWRIVTNPETDLRDGKCTCPTCSTDAELEANLKNSLKKDGVELK